MAAEQPQPVIAPETRVPRRFWWLNRLAGAYILFLVAVWGLRSYADRVAQRKLDSEIAAIHAKGEPILLQDFVEPQTPEEDNAAAYLTRAAAAIKFNEADQKAFDNLPQTIPFSPADVQLLDRVIPQHAMALDLARQARDERDVNWHIQFSTPVIDILLPHLNGQRELANLLVAAALHAHQKGDDAAAIEYLRDILTIGRAVNRQPFLVSHLVAAGTTAIADNAVMQIAPGLKKATPEQMRALLNDLLDERPLRQGFIRAMQGERMFQFDTLTAMAYGRMGAAGPGAPMLSSTASYFARPILLKDTRGLLRFGNAFVEAARQQDLASTKAMMPLAPVGTAKYKQPFVGMLLPALATVPGRHYMMIRSQRLAAIALAERMYELDHGRKAAAVEDLSPRYLPDVLEDPMATKGTKLGLSGGN